MRGRMFLAAVLMASVVVAVGMEPGQSRISGKTWFRYYYQTVGDETVASGFRIARGYFAFCHQFTDKISSKFNVDIYSSDAPTDTKGAGLKIKAAYLKFEELPILGGDLYAGIVSTKFGALQNWKYITIERELADKEGVIASADAGMFLSRKLPAGFGDFQVSIYNGEGYSKSGTNIDKYPAFGFNLNFTPVKPLTLRGSVNFTSAEETTVDSLGNESSEKYNIFRSAAVAELSVWRLSFTGEFAFRKNGDTVSKGFMVFPVISLSSKFDLVARYDFWDPDDSRDDDAHSRVIAGFNWRVFDGGKTPSTVMLQVNWERTSYQNSSIDPTDQITAQLRWEFKSNAF